MSASEMIPNITSMMHVMLQLEGGVQSNTLKEVVLLTMQQCKLLETDTKQLTHSLPMLKALESNIVLLVATGLPVQMVWVDLPMQFRTFAAMVSEAGGGLDNNVPAQSLATPDEEGYHQFLKCQEEN
eukprot:27830-Rhodomonas_salina.3